VIRLVRCERVDCRARLHRKIACGRGSDGPEPADHASRRRMAQFLGPSRNGEWPSLGTACLAKNAITSADRRLAAPLGNQIDRAGSGLLCGVWLVILTQQSSKVKHGLRWRRGGETTWGKDNLGVVETSWWTRRFGTSGKERRTRRGDLFRPIWWGTTIEVVLFDTVRGGDDCEKYSASAGSRSAPALGRQGHEANHPPSHHHLRQSI